MYPNVSQKFLKFTLSTMTAALALYATLATAAEPAATPAPAAQAVAGAPDATLAAWLGREFTVSSATSNQHMPVGGKLTFAFDASANVVRICTRTVNGQEGPWRMDLAAPCGVALTYTAGTHYCSAEDVKAGNAEVLASCHRLRSRDVAMHPSTVKGAVELNDMIAFPVKEADGKLGMAIIVDSPSRVTDGTVIVIKQ